MIIGILGAGTWGTAIGQVFSDNGHQVAIWTRSKEKAHALNESHQHPYLPESNLSENIHFTSDLGSVCLQAELIVIAVPSSSLRPLLQSINFNLTDKKILCLTKGIEKGSLLFMSDIIEQTLNLSSKQIAALSGPTHAEEVISRLPTACTVASKNLSFAEEIQELLNNDYFRTVISPDLKGTELCGALKNIIALACGMITGLGYGDNTKAAIVTAGLNEIKRLGQSLGTVDNTFLSLAGVGDVIATSTSMHSRNFKYGLYLGQGNDQHEAQAKVGMVVEGVNALSAAMDLQKLYDVKMPIIEAVFEIIFSQKKAADIISALIKAESSDEENREQMASIF